MSRLFVENEAKTTGERRRVALRYNARQESIGASRVPKLHKGSFNVVIAGICSHCASCFVLIRISMNKIQKRMFRGYHHGHALDVVPFYDTVNSCVIHYASGWTVTVLTLTSRYKFSKVLFSRIIPRLYTCFKSHLLKIWCNTGKILIVVAFEK